MHFVFEKTHFIYTLNNDKNPSIKKNTNSPLFIFSVIINVMSQMVADKRQIKNLL